MARVPLVDPDAHPELADIVERIRGARRGSVIKLYRLLLNSPPLAGTWLDHVNAVRWKTTLDGRLRELIIIRIGQAKNVGYVLRQHVPRLSEAEGISEAECAALADWRASGLFSVAERAALAYADAMTDQITVPDAIYAELARHFPDPRQIVELTVLVATYNMHARVVTALELDPEP